MRQQQSCCINLSAPGEQCTGLFSVHLGLNAVSGSKTAAPLSNPCLSLIWGRMLGQLQLRAGGRRPGHCHELSPPSLELHRYLCKAPTRAPRGTTVSSSGERWLRVLLSQALTSPGTLQLEKCCVLFFAIFILWLGNFMQVGAEAGWE